MTFYGAPSGEDRTPFHWVASRSRDVTFVNAAHDYPQRIRYWREGKELVAEISLKDGTKAQRWRYARAGELGAGALGEHRQAASLTSAKPPVTGSSPARARVR